MKAFRIARTEFIRDLSGFGAYKFGGRWNSIGTSILYLAQNPSLALLEVLVHIPQFQIQSSFSILTLELPELDIQSTPTLPKNWKIHPPPIELKRIGDAFVRSNAGLILRVPSAIMHLDMSLLVNPSHPDFQRIKILDCEELELEKRLFRVETIG